MLLHCLFWISISLCNSVFIKIEENQRELHQKQWHVLLMWQLGLPTQFYCQTMSDKTIICFCVIILYYSRWSIYVDWNCVHIPQSRLKELACESWPGWLEFYPQNNYTSTKINATSKIKYICGESRPDTVAFFLMNSTIHFRTSWLALCSLKGVFVRSS